MNKFVALAIAVVILVSCVVFIPKLVHTCDDCGDVFLGTGYEPNVVIDLFSDEQEIICKECAEIQHAISTALGKSLDDFKRGLFE